MDKMTGMQESNVFDGLRINPVKNPNGAEIIAKLNPNAAGKVDYVRQGGQISKINVKPASSENRFEVTPRPGNQPYQVTCVSPEGVRRPATSAEIKLVQKVFEASLPNVVDPEADLISDGLQRAADRATPPRWIDIPIPPMPRAHELPTVIPLTEFPTVKPVTDPFANRPIATTVKVTCDDNGPTATFRPDAPNLCGSTPRKITVSYNDKGELVLKKTGGVAVVPENFHNGSLKAETTPDPKEVAGLLKALEAQLATLSFDDPSRADVAKLVKDLSKLVFGQNLTPLAG